MTGVGEHAEKEERSSTAGRNANWCSHSGKVWSFLRMVKTELPYDPAIAPLSIYPRIQKY